MFNSVDILFDLESESVVLSQITRTYDDRGDATESATTSDIDVIVLSEQDPNRGVFKFADLTNESLVIYSKTRLNEGDIITHDSDDWVIQTTKKVDSGLYASLLNKKVV